MEKVNAIGRRKAAVARVYLTEGSGNIVIDKRPIVNTLEVADKYDIYAHIDGGGYKGQAEALRLAISRALVKINAEDKPALRAEGFMTRDPRAVERKKPGQPKARKRFQFSKR